MGRKSSSKGQSSSSSKPVEKASGFSPVLIVAIVVAVLGVGAYSMWSNGASPSSTSSSTQVTPESVAAAAAPTPDGVAKAQKSAALGPHKQATLPPIPFQGYAPPRPAEVVTAAFHFAAEHPEVASYQPCFCGCQQGGHVGNEDCFVRSRDANGDVVEWEPHGVDCAVCLDVATRSRQMHASGASVTQIRAAIEKEFLPTAVTMTPTPKPPAAAQ